MTIPDEGYPRRYGDCALDAGDLWNGRGWQEWSVYACALNSVVIATENGILRVGAGEFQPAYCYEGPKYYEPIPGLPLSNSIVKWNDDGTWEILGNGILHNGHYASVHAIAEAPNGDVFAGGPFHMDTPYGPCNSVAWWDGQEWRPVQSGVLDTGSNLPAYVYDIEVGENGDVYVCGDFNMAGGEPAHYVAKAIWNEALQEWDWTPLGRTVGYVLNGSVQELVFYEGDLYAGGAFTQYNQQIYNHLARWDSTDWQPLEGGASIGVGGSVTALDAGTGGLYIGGHFTQAGGQAVGYIVQYGRYKQPELYGPEPVVVETNPTEGSEVILEADMSHHCGSPLTVTWNVDGGDPEAVIETDPSDPGFVQTVPFDHFYTPGVHVVTILVEDGKADPAFHATTVTVKAPAVAQLSGSAADDGLPAGSALQTCWTVVSGPAAVNYDNPASPATNAYLSQPGTYILRLTADDSEYERSDEVTIYVKEKNLPNQPPTVFAGSNRFIDPGETVSLSGTVQDDGLPGGFTDVEWSVTDGPGSVMFSHPTNLQTTAQFSAGGLYTIRLTADDSEFSSYDELTVRVSTIINQPPTVDAGPDATLPLNQRAPLYVNASDDGLPIGLLDISWEQLSGPGHASIYRQNDMTLAKFTNAGVYELCVYATDGKATVSDDVTVTVTEDFLPPRVQLDVPVDGSEVTAPTPVIGSVSGLSLDTYQLFYKRKNKTDWTLFHTGAQPVLEGELGEFDPTLLKNGLYDIRLHVTDVFGQTYADTTSFVIKGGMKVGNFTVSFTDLAIPVSGIPIQIMRTYDSRMRDEQGDFGYGWTLDISAVDVEESAHLGMDWIGINHGGMFPTYEIRPRQAKLVTVIAIDGSVHIFDAQISPATQWLVPQQTVSMDFIPRPGTNSTLRAIASTDLYVSGTFNSTGGYVQLLDFSTLNLFDPDRYELTLKNGTKLEIIEIDGLEKLTDRNDNTLQITENGIIHSSGKSVSFTRDTQGRITRIKDPMNNNIDYTYDANGDLTGVTDQEEYTTTFAYNEDHFCTDITDTRGIRAARQLYDDDGRMIAMVDAEGDTIHLNHELDAQSEMIRDRLGNVSIYLYDDSGNVIAKTDARGNKWQATYDAVGNKLSESDPYGNTITYTYDNQGNKLSKTDPVSNDSTWTYNANGQVLTALDDAGNTVINTYDVNGNLLTQQDPEGNVITNTYDTSGNLTSMSDGNGRDLSFEYNTDGRLTRMVDPYDHETTFTYDANGNQLTRTTTRTTPTGTETLTKTYDDMNRVVQITDPEGGSVDSVFNAIGKIHNITNLNGHTMRYEYTATGDTSKIVYPDSTYESWTYDAESRKTAFRDRGGRVTQYTYDANGNLILTLYPDGSTIQQDYDDANRMIGKVDQRGFATRYEYDDAGRNTTVTDALGKVTQYSYDGNNRKTRMVDANGHATRWEYDTYGRITKTVLNDSTFTLTTYNLLGKKTSFRDQAGITTWYNHDLMGRLTSVQDTLNQVTRYEYDEVGNMTKMIDANSHETRFEYDTLGRLTKKILPLGQYETYTYDANGNKLTRTDFNGQTINYVYDEMDRLVTKDFPTGTDETYTYTNTGQQQTVTDARGVTEYIYDAMDRVLQRTDPDGQFVTYQYDSAGNRTRLFTPADSTVYTFDALNRTATVSHAATGVTQYTYDNVGNLESTLYPNATRADYTYSDLSRLTKLFNHTGAGDTVSCYSYTLGATGNRIRVEEHTGRIVNYVFDETYRLLEEQIADPDFGNQTILYTYDNAGNRLTKDDGAVLTQYDYDDNNRLITETKELAVTTYTYDNNGNTIAKTSPTENTAYTYDYQNRMISADVTMNAVQQLIEYQYDADGIRTQKKIGSNITNFLVDKNREFAQVLEERDGSGSLTVSYLHGLDLISQNRGGNVSYYHYDGQHSTRQLSDVSTQVTDTYTYDAFGLLLQRTGSTENNYLYSGEQFDPNVGFYYLRARYYNPEIGRFTTVDPWKGSIYDPASLHKYICCQNDPVDYVDWSGEMGTLVSLTLTIVFIGVLAAITSVIILAGSHTDEHGKTHWDEITTEEWVLAIIGVVFAMVFAGLGGPMGILLAAIVLHIFMAQWIILIDYLWP